MKFLFNIKFIIRYSLPLTLVLFNFVTLKYNLKDWYEAWGFPFPFKHWSGVSSGMDLYYGWPLFVDLIIYFIFTSFVFLLLKTIGMRLKIFGWKWGLLIWIPLFLLIGVIIFSEYAFSTKIIWRNFNIMHEIDGWRIYFGCY